MPIAQATTIKKPKKPKPISVETRETTAPVKVPKAPEGQAGRAGRSTGGNTYDAPDKSGTSLAAPRGSKVTKGMTNKKAKSLATATKKASAEGTSSALKGGGGGGGKKTAGGGGGSKTQRSGKWTQGAVGQWKAGSTKTRSGGGGGGGAAGGGRAGGGGGLQGAFKGGNVGSRNRMDNSDGSSWETDSDNEGGQGGGGGTGNPLGAAMSALEGKTLKPNQTVEDFARGAKKTRKTGAKRTQ
jgi:hypothetical protein